MKKIMALVLAGIMVLGGCTGSTDSASEDTEKDSAQNSSQEVKEVTILTGPSGGTMEIVGAATIELFKAAMPGTEFSSVPSTGSAVNVKLMDNGEADMAIITADTLAAAINGEEPFEEEYPDLMSMCALYPNTMQLWALPSSGIQDFADLKSKKFTCGQFGGGPYQPCMNMMKTYGFTLDDIEASGGEMTPLAWGEATNSLQDGNIDAVFWTTSFPAAGIVNAAVGKEFSLVQINEEKLKEYTETYEEWVDITIPAGTYEFQKEDVKTIGTPNLYVVSRDMPEDVVYEMTKAICENYDVLGTSHALLKSLSDETITQGVVGEIHPGALRYYKEKGINVS